MSEQPFSGSASGRHRAPERHALLAGGLILFISIGARQGFGLFLLPVTQSLGISREAFASTVALQYLVWGLAGPLAGILADRYGPVPVLVAGGLCYALGFASAAQATTAGALAVTAGLLIGLGLGAANYGVVHGAIAGRFDARHRGRALGAVSAMTAFGQFALLFFTDRLLTFMDWRSAFHWHAGLVITIVPLCWWLRRCPGADIGPDPAHDAIATPPSAPAGGGWAALAGAAARRDFWLLCAGFGCSGFHVMFTMTHLPAMLHDRHVPERTAVWALAAVSLAAFVGSWVCGRLADRMDKRRLLAALYVGRAIFALALLVWPFEPVALLGLVWTSTIPVASGLTAQLYGSRHLATLFSVVFLAHQVGGFAGTWLGGRVYDQWHDYRPMWLLVAALCLFGAVATLRIAPSEAADGRLGRPGTASRHSQPGIRHSRRDGGQ